MERRAFITVVGGSILGASLAAEAQQPNRIPRLGYLSYGSGEIDKSLLAALRQGLRDLGYSEGQSIVIEERYAAGESDKLPELVADFIRIKVDLIVVTGDPAAYAAREATRAIPIVIVTSPDPVGTGLIAAAISTGAGGSADRIAVARPTRATPESSPRPRRASGH